MNPLVKRVVAEHRVAVLALTVGLVANLLAYVLVVRPLTVKSTGAASRAVSAAAALLAAEQEVAAAEALVNGKARADEELQAFFNKVLPADMTAARRMTYASLPKLARHTGVVYEARTTEVEDVNKDSRLARMTIRMNLQGEYDSIRQFIYQLESAPEFVIIDDVTLVENASDEALRLTVNLSTYFRGRANGS